MDEFPTVLVTGFGPFPGHDINASWETAKELKKLGLDSWGIDLIIKEIPVSYDYASKEVPLIWKYYRPKLMVHMGVSGLAKEITLESTAHRCGYVKPDIAGQLPEDGCGHGTHEVLQTKRNLEDVRQRIMALPHVRITPCISTDAGRFLCEFTYYTSLNINSSGTVFIHVPVIDKPYSVKEMAECVKYIIIILIAQMEIGNKNFELFKKTFAVNNEENAIIENGNSTQEIKDSEENIETGTPCNSKFA